MSKFVSMISAFPLQYSLADGTHVEVYKMDENCYEFLMTRLNSEKHNFYLKEGKIEESYETRFDKWQHEAVEKFQSLLNQDNPIS